MQFYHSTCPPAMPGQMTSQQQQQQAAGVVLLQQQQVQRNDQQQHSTVITINDDNKESLQLNVSFIKYKNDINKFFTVILIFIATTS